MDRRVRITLPEPVICVLEGMADETDEPVARVAARLVRDRLEELGADGAGSRTRPPSPARGAAPARRPDKRPPWLEPYGGDREWRRLMWGAIAALHGRYPDELRGLKQGWWEDAAHVETLCALVVWRDWLDEAGDDPREELNFQFTVADFARKLNHEGGGVTKTWTPGPAPDEWR